MKDFVVCIKENWVMRGKPYSGSTPKRGEIYELEGIVNDNHTCYYVLKGYHTAVFNINHFRPTDISYGELVEQKIREKVAIEPN